MTNLRVLSGKPALWSALCCSIAIVFVVAIFPLPSAGLDVRPPSPPAVAQADGDDALSAATHVYAYAYSHQDVHIWEMLNWMWSAVYVTGAPADAVVAWVDINLTIRTDINDLAVRYCPEAVDVDKPSQCATVGPGDDGIDDSFYHLTEFAGRPVNGSWYLGALDHVMDGDAGFIDYWSIRVYYALSSPQPTPTPTPPGYRVVDVPAIADAMTSQGNVHANFGKATALHAGYLRQLRSWFKFDIPAANIPADALNARAELILWHQAGGDASLDVFAPLANWNEMTLSWLNQPDYDPHPVGSRWVSTEPPMYARWDISQLMGQWVLNERPNYGLMITDHFDTRSAIFTSRESADTRLRPILRISYQEPPRTPTTTATPAPPTATATETATATPTLPPPPYVQRVNCGGPAYSDTLGQVWAADKPFAPGSWGYVGGSAFVTSHAIANTADDLLYQTERFWGLSATPGYRFAVPNGWYQVTLKFAEIYRTGAYARQFTVVMEGITQLSNYEPFLAAGGHDRAAPDVSFVVPVSDGELTVDLLRNPLYDGPKVSAVEVMALGASGATLTPTPTATGGQTTPVATSTPTATTAGARYEQRVNAGGAAYADALGHVWAADRAFTAGSWGHLGGRTFSTAHVIANTDDDPLYQSERFWGESAIPGYRFTVPNGTYQVTLRFAEIYRTAPNSRLFNVSIEGIVQLVNYQPFTAAGGHDVAAPDVAFLVNVTDNMLTIDFIRSPLYDGPKVSAIAVLQQ